MRYPADQKAKTRERILEAAGRVFRRQGYQGSGVDAVMKEAGLTHGGFYSHFRNKEALFAEAVMGALLGMRDKHAEWTEGAEEGARLRSLVDSYLSPDHLQSAEEGCPVPPLVSELSRSGQAPKRAFENGLLGWAADVAEHFPEGSDQERIDRALGVVVACVGGLALARAVDDPQMAERVLGSARALVVPADAPPTSDRDSKH